MKINQLKIEGVGGIVNLDLQFNEKMNLLCGPNGIGKTTVLEIIAHLFAIGNTDLLKRNVNSKEGVVEIFIEAAGKQQTKKLSFQNFSPQEPIHIREGFRHLSKYVLSIKANRIVRYKSLNSITKDQIKTNNTIWGETIGGVNLNEVKNWFINRYLYSPHKRALPPEHLHNFEISKSCFSALDESVSFSRVDASLNEIMVNTASGEIYYEYLSSGFKSIMSILFGIIKEIEYRFTEERLTADKFFGVILIDEIGLHLHPNWQEKIINVLHTIFPKAQIFATTHSPHVIQHAPPEQIIALEFDNKLVKQRVLPLSEFGFQGWTIEEVLTDVMGMSDTRTDLFNRLIHDFQIFIEKEQFDSANDIFTKLDKMLHPNNHLRKLLKFQLAEVK